MKNIHSEEFYLRYICFKGFNWRYRTDFTQEQIFELCTKKAIEGLSTALQDTSIEQLKAKSFEFFPESKLVYFHTLEAALQEKIKRLEYELFVVHEMGFDAYFLIVADYINWARNNGIPVGPGR